MKVVASEMKCRAHRRWPAPGAICAVATVLLVSCVSSPPIEPHDTNYQHQIDTLEAQLAKTLTANEQAQMEEKHQWDSLQSEIHEIARREQATTATISRLRAELRQGHQTSDATSQSTLDLLLELRRDFAAESRAHDELVLKIVERLNGNDDLRDRLARLEKDIDTDLAASLMKVADTLTKEKPFLAQVAATLTGTILGAVLALVSGWLLARRTQAVSDEQKRQDVTIKIIETYLSETMLTKYGNALWLLQQGWSSLSAPEAQNKILEMIGFFKYALTLEKKKRLDVDLFALSEIGTKAHRFFASVRSAKVPKGTPEWDLVTAQLPPPDRS
jgi:hypothetical protein